MKMMYIMYSMTIITPMLKHPLSMGFMLIFQTTLICINLSMLTKSSWYSYILFISIISGMMIMFMYMASITSNEKFKYNKYFLIMTIMITFTFLIFNNQMIEMINKFMEYKFNTMNLEELKSTTKFFNLNKSMLTILMIMTLLITMITTTNLTSNFEGPLKKK